MTIHARYLHEMSPDLFDSVFGQRYESAANFRDFVLRHELELRAAWQKRRSYEDLADAIMSHWSKAWGAALISTDTPRKFCVRAAGLVAAALDDAAEGRNEVVTFRAIVPVMICSRCKRQGSARPQEFRRITYDQALPVDYYASDCVPPDGWRYIGAHRLCPDCAPTVVAALKEAVEPPGK